MEEVSFEDIKNSISNLEKIGEGWRGTVYKGILNGEALSFKVPKSRDFITIIRKEGEILKKVNRFSIGSPLKILGKDFIAYRYIDGNHLKDILNGNNYKILFFQLLEQARKLDNLQINKDEMHRPLKNVLVDKNLKIYLIDFERAKFSKKVQNITQLLQFFLSVKDRYLTNIDKNEIIKLAKIYKKNPIDENYKKILNYLDFKC